MPHGLGLGGGAPHPPFMHSPYTAAASLFWLITPYLLLMSQLVLVRHGQSTSNLANVFTGELNVNLTAKGEQEAHETARKLQGFQFDVAYTSVLRRAERTLEIILHDLHLTTIPVEHNAALNERNYGDLQGLNKEETAQKYGADQVNEWRRSYDVAPPGGESLQQTQQRVVAYYTAEIVPHLQQDQRVLIVAHGNSLRALSMYLEDMSPEEVLHLEIPTGGARVYDLDAQLKVQKQRTL